MGWRIENQSATGVVWMMCLSALGAEEPDYFSCRPGPTQFQSLCVWGGGGVGVGVLSVAGLQDWWIEGLSL